MKIYVRKEGILVDEHYWELLDGVLILTGIIIGAVNPQRIGEYIDKFWVMNGERGYQVVD